MLKRINWNFVFKCFAWIFCLVGIVTLMSFVEVKKHSVNCTNIKILIPGADNFIEREEIDAILRQSEGQLIGRKLEDINLHAIEDKIKANPYIALSTVYADMDGVIHIEISQRQPLLRIINAGGQDYYIDRFGLKMPVSPNFTANVLVANGHILEHFGGRVDTLITKMASDLYKTAGYLKKDSLWDAQIEQIFVNDNDDIILIPRVGNQRIILGDADSLDTKMNNLLTFYKKAMPQVGWDTYKTINIKYTNQIVCEKNKPDSIHTANGYVAAKSVMTPVTAKKVMDSIVRAEIASELHKNPDENIMDEPAESNAPAGKSASFPAVRIIPAPKLKPTVKPVIKAKPAVKPAAIKPVIKKEVKKTEVKKAAVKKADIKKTEVKKTVKPAVKPVTTKPAVKASVKTTVKTTAKTTVKPAVKKETKATVKSPVKKTTKVVKPQN
jgi:cell division protein FtsQ